MSDWPPIPAKRSWDYPLPLDAVSYFIHPGGQADFEQAWRTGEYTVLAGNGYMAAEFEAAWADEFADIPERVADRFAKLPWLEFDRIPPKAPQWGELHDAVPELFRFGPRLMWEVSRVGSVARYHWRNEDSVNVAMSGHTVSTAALQLCSRLPRSMVWRDSGKSACIVTFNGGRVILPANPKLTRARKTVLMPRVHFDGKVDW